MAGVSWLAGWGLANMRRDGRCVAGCTPGLLARPGPALRSAGGQGEQGHTAVHTGPAVGRHPHPVKGGVAQAGGRWLRGEAQQAWELRWELRWEFRNYGGNYGGNSGYCLCVLSPVSVRFFCALVC